MFVGVVVGGINSSLNDLVKRTEVPLAWFDTKLDREGIYQRVIVEEAISERSGVEGAKDRILRVIGKIGKK